MLIKLQDGRWVDLSDVKVIRINEIIINGDMRFEIIADTGECLSIKCGCYDDRETARYEMDALARALNDMKTCEMPSFNFSIKRG